MTAGEFFKKYAWLLIPLLLVLVSFYGGMKYGERRAVSHVDVVADTVTKVVTIYKDFPQPIETAKIGYIAVPMYKFLTDTVNTVETAYLHDTTVVYLPREQKCYEEENGSLRLWVSGYDPRLDRYELDKTETVITNTVTVKPSRWGISIYGGYGAAYYDKRVILAPSIGIGITYTFLRL